MSQVSLRSGQESRAAITAPVAGSSYSTAAPCAAQLLPEGSAERARMPRTTETLAVPCHATAKSYLCATADRTKRALKGRERGDARDQWQRYARRAAGSECAPTWAACRSLPDYQWSAFRHQPPRGYCTGLKIHSDKRKLSSQQLFLNERGRPHRGSAEGHRTDARICCRRRRLSRGRNGSSRTPARGRWRRCPHACGGVRLDGSPRVGAWARVCAACAAPLPPAVTSGGRWPRGRVGCPAGPL